MSINNDKLWLLQNEKALLAIIREPNRPLHSICQAYNTKFDDLSEFLEKYCPEGASLTAGRLQELKVELGIITETRGSAGAGLRAVALSPVPATAAEEGKALRPAPRLEDDEDDAEESSRPWLNLSRRPKAKTVHKYRSRIEAIAAGEVRTGTEGSWYATLNKWFGTVNPTAIQARLFLIYVDGVPGGEDSSQAAEAPKARKPRQAKAKPAKKARAAKVERVAKAKPARRPAKVPAPKKKELLDRLAQYQKDVARYLWNLAGCETIASGWEKPFDYAKDDSLPALDSVSRLAQQLRDLHAQKQLLEQQQASRRVVLRLFGLEVSFPGKAAQPIVTGGAA